MFLNKGSLCALPWFVSSSLLSIFTSSPKRETDQQDIVAFTWWLMIMFFRLSFFQLKSGGIFHPPTTHSMQLNPSDEVPMVPTRTRRVFAVIKFPFDAVRMLAMHHSLLYVTYRILRYQWNCAGVVSYLEAHDRYSLAVTNFAAWDEYAKRITDDLDISPVAGAVDSAVLPLQIAPG